MRIVLVSDLHYAPGAPDALGALEDIFLLRLVHRVNRWLKPDLVALAGDLSHHSEPGLQALRAALDKLAVPWLAVPGNHDPAPEVFFRHFPRPPEFLDVGGWRVIPVLSAAPGADAGEAGPAMAARLRALAQGKRVATLHHHPLCPPGAAGASRWGHRDAAALLAAGVDVALSGHDHAGVECRADVGGRPFAAIGAPAEYKGAHPYLVLDFPDDGAGAEAVTARRECLALPPEAAALGLCDTHVHTRLAYCAEDNWDAPRLFAMARATGLSRFAFTEHSGHLYTTYPLFRDATLDREGLARHARVNRYGDYRALLAAMAGEPLGRGLFVPGLEVDVDAQCRPILAPADGAGLDFRIGALHHLTNRAERLEDAKREFLARCEGLCRFGVKVLAHPFRVFRKRLGMEPPAELFAPLAAMLAQYGVAAEINYHGNHPEPEFFSLCLRQGVRLTFGSDTHNLYEIGEFYANLRLLREIGGQPEDLLRLPPGDAASMAKEER